MQIHPDLQSTYPRITAEWRSAATSTLLEYSTKIPPITGTFCTTKEKLHPHSRLYGIELEVVPSAALYKTHSLIPRSHVFSDVVHKVYVSMPGAILCKKDSSVSGGFEIVSAPATLAAHRIMWTRFFYENGSQENWRLLLKNHKHPTTGIARSLSSYTQLKCGMHIHCALAGFDGTSSIVKLWRFLNDIRLDEYFIRIAGRKMNTYCARQQNIGFSNMFNTPRHSMLNLTNTETAEIRIFQGNTSPLGFMKNLDFCDALITFCNNTSLRGVNGHAFLAFVRENPSSWPFFNKWLHRHHHYLSGAANKAM